MVIKRGNGVIFRNPRGVKPRNEIINAGTREHGGVRELNTGLTRAFLKTDKDYYCWLVFHPRLCRVSLFLMSNI